MRRCATPRGPGMGRSMLALVALATVVAIIIARPLAEAVSSLLHLVVEIVEVVLIIVASALGLAILCGLCYLAGVLRLRYLAGQRALAARAAVGLVLHQTAEQVTDSAAAGAIESNRSVQIPAIEAPEERLWQPPLPPEPRS